jgi:hypothetical protein
MAGPKSGGAAGIKSAPGSITNAPRLPRSTLRDSAPRRDLTPRSSPTYPTPLMLCGPPNGLTNDMEVRANVLLTSTVKWIWHAIQ